MKKETIQRLVEKYIEEGLSPSDQPEPRDKKYFDIRGISQELYEWLKDAPNDMSDAQLESIIRKIMRISERDANTFKIHRVTELNISSAFQNFTIP